MNEIFLDTETTGLSLKEGHKIVEIACIETKDLVATGKVFHKFINPKRSVPEEAFKVHGFSSDFLSDKDTFDKVADEFIQFVKGKKIIIHNAAFDLGFLNGELGAIKKELIDKNLVIDSLSIARNKFPGTSNSLDSLCKKFNIDTKERVAKGHGALVDCYLLSEVYLEILGGKQPNFNLNKDYEKLEREKDGKKTNYFYRQNNIKTRLNDKVINKHLDFINEINCKNSWGMFHKSLLDKLNS